MVNRKDDLPSILRAIQQQARNVSLPETATVQAIRTVSEAFALADAPVEIEERALSTQGYLAVPPDSVVNGDFETDLTGWTESISAGLTATTIQQTAEAKTLFASLGALQVDVTASTATGQARRFQDIVASVGQVWSFEAWFKGSSFANAEARLRLQWLTAGFEQIGAVVTAVSTDVASDWTVRLAVENQTAPATTATARIYLEVNVTTSGGTGKAWFDLARAELAQTAVSSRARRIRAGEWVART